MEQTAGSMSNDYKKWFLRRYVSISREIDRQLEECEYIRAKLSRIIATISDMPMGGGPIYKNSDKDLDLMEKIIYLQKRMNADTERLIDIRMEIMETIAAQEDDQERLLLEYRYLDGHSWVKIAVLMSYEWAQTHRIHSRALMNLKLNLHNLKHDTQ